MIGFLVDRKFPLLLTAIGPGGRGMRADLRLKAKQEADTYRVQLSGIPKDELNALFQREMRKKDEELTIHRLREDEARFFNQASAIADYSYWTKAAYWTLDEAVALAMGKNPEIVNPTSLAAYRTISPFVQRFDRFRNLAGRAVGIGKLFDPVLPSVFVNWTLENEIEIPDVMREAVVAGASRIDWEATSKHQMDLVEKLDRIFKLQQAEISNLTAAVADLKQQLAEVPEPQFAPEPTVKPQSPVERDNMLKVILAMAMDVYGHDPAKARSTAVGDICSALDLVGLHLSDDTVRRYLDAAEERLPEWRESKA